MSVYFLNFLLYLIIVAFCTLLPSLLPSLPVAGLLFECIHESSVYLD
jgi:hypothetical protein